MKKKNIIISTILGLSALAVITPTTVKLLNDDNNVEKEETTILEESNLAEDDIFSGGLKSVAVKQIVKKQATGNEIYTPKIGRQFSLNNDGTKVSIRFFAAITDLDIDAKWTRALYNKDGSVNSALPVGEKISTKAYSSLAYLDDDNNVQYLSATDVEAEDHSYPYKYFVTYTLKNITIDTYKNCELRCFVELSNNSNVVYSKEGSVTPDAKATMGDSTELSLDLDFYDTYHSNKNTSHNNGQYITASTKTIYAADEDFDSSHLFASARGRLIEDWETSGFTKGNTGKQTITVSKGNITASYDVYVINQNADNAIYKDANDNYVVSVDPNYSGTIGAVNSTNGNMFKTIGQALEFLQNTKFVPQNANKILNIGAGYYYEKLEINTPNLTINGAGSSSNTADSSKTIIEYDSLAGYKDINNFEHLTDSTQTVSVRESAVNCKINNVTISNKYNDIRDYDGTIYQGSGERALALLVQSDQFVMNGCALLGWQDTLELFTGRQYFNNTYICGTVDFIFGTNNTSYFDSCDIEVKKSKDGSISSNVTAYITAFKGQNANANDAITYGGIFNNCNIYAESGFVGKYAIARPWTVNSSVAVLNSTFDTSLATKESETIHGGLISGNNNVSTLKMKFYNNKYTNDNPVTFTDDLSNVDTTLNSTSAANYTTYSVIFGKNNGGVSYALAWDPINGLEQDNNVYHVFHGDAPTTGTSYTYEGAQSASTYTLNGITFNNCQRRTGGNDDLMVGGYVSFDVKAGTTVTVTSYPNYHGYKIGDVYANNDVVTYYFDTAQTVKLEKVSGTFYLYSIAINETLPAPEEKELQSIALVGQPSSDYAIGDNYDLSNLKVKAYFDDGTYEYSTDFTTNASEVVDKTKAGTYTVTVTYNYGTTSKTATFDVIYTNVVETTIKDGTIISFGENGNYNTTVGVTNTCTVSEGNGQVKNGTITLSLKYPALIHISGNWSVDYLIGETSVIHTNASQELATGGNEILEYDYYASAGDLVITPYDRGKNYFNSISVTYLAPLYENTTISFGSSGNYKAITGLIYTSVSGDNGGNNSQLGYTNKVIAFGVDNNATVTISSYNGYTHYTITANGVTSSEQTGTSYAVTVTNGGAVVIRSTNANNYFYSITITYPSN